MTTAIALAMAVGGILLAATGAIVAAAAPMVATEDGATFTEWVLATATGVVIGTMVFVLGVTITYLGALFLP